MVFKQVYKLPQRLFKENICRGWKMAKHEDLSSNPRTHPNMALCIPVTPTVQYGDKGLMMLAGFKTTPVY